LVPRETRPQRVARLKQASDFAKRCGIAAIETEAGFIPESPNDPLYRDTIEALRDVIGHCRGNGTTFLYHAGSETSVTMLRVLQDVGLDNQAVGLDTANPILYGTGHPCDALEVYGRHVRAVNAKDGLWPTDPRHLGQETPIGEGKVDFPRLIRRLRELPYAGPITIERETTGPQQIEDIKRSKVYLERLLKEVSPADQGGSNLLRGVMLSFTVARPPRAECD
jgi:sugar phosphate isomerase/epimerase